VTAFTEWIPSVRVEVPNCPAPLVVDAVRQSVIDFCRRSRCWRYECDTLPAVADVREYALDVPVQSVVIAIRSLRVNGTPLAEESIDVLDQTEPGWRTATGLPIMYTLVDSGTIMFYGQPQEDASIDAVVALMPSQDAETCGDVIYDEWKQAITTGAVSRLRGMTGMEWSDLQASDYLRAKYEGAVIDTTSRLSGANTTTRTIRSRARFL
jgi:hypothetical protein